MPLDSRFAPLFVTLPRAEMTNRSGENDGGAGIQNDGAALTGWCFTTDPTRHWHENAESGTIRHKLPGCTSRLKPSADDTPC